MPDAEDEVEESEEIEAPVEENETTREVQRALLDRINTTAVGILAFTLLGMGGFALLPTTVADILSFELNRILSIEMLLAIFLFPLPFAFTALRSRTGFRRESVVAIIGVAFAPLGGTFALGGLTFAVGCPYVSWKTSRSYIGAKENDFHAFYKGLGAAIVALGLVAGGLFAGAYLTEPAVQEDVTETATDTALDIAGDVIGTGTNENGGQIVPVERQKTLARNLVDFVRNHVMREVQEDGSFSRSQQHTLRDAFADAKTNLTAQIEQRQGQLQQIQQQENETSPVRSGIGGMIANILEPSPGTALLFFAAIFSITLIFKIPFALLGAGYALALERLFRKI